MIYAHKARLLKELEVASQLEVNEHLWRIVDFNLADKDNIIDWTHEREWRVKNNFDFELEDVTIVLNDSNDYSEFISTIYKYEYHNILLKIQGIVTLRNLLM